MRDFPELPADCRIDSRAIVSVQVGPDGRIAVEIFATAHVAQHGPFTRDYDDWFAPEPVAHLREGMPHTRAIQLGELMHVGSARQTTVSRQTRPPPLGSHPRRRARR